MILFNFYDFDDFKYIFGMESHGNGVKSRKNKILLQHIKSPALIKYCREHNDWSLLRIRSMAELKQTVLNHVMSSGKEDKELNNKVELIGNTYWSAIYRTDSLKGLCEDFDKKAVRYVNTRTERVFKMKAGKFFASIIKETEIGQILSHQVINWLSEEFTQDWQTYTYGQTPEVELHVDDNFRLIYDGSACHEFNGCSCMVDRDRHRFYEDSVKAKAAYILDRDGYVLARAILFTDVTDQNGRKWRLLERQYSRKSNEVLKRLLVDLLIKGDYIDGYKQVGAGCSESRAFVSNDGTSLTDMEFSIECDLELYEVLSYQDSFKFYDYNHGIAYNFPHPQYGYCLDTTDRNLNGDDEDEEEEEYDEYHDYYCDQVRICYYHGSEINVDADNLDDFIWIEEEGDYFHKDDVTRCRHCGKFIVIEDHPMCRFTSSYFCSDSCHEQYMKEHYHYSEYDKGYFLSESDIKIVNIWNDELQTYRCMTIYKETLLKLISNRQAYGAGDIWFLANLSEALKSA